MTALVPPTDRPYAIETVRAVAVLFLVSYHVVGAEPGDGLRLDYPHPLRVLSELLDDIRMPLFAAISGAVYALRPVSRERMTAFLVGKLRRLAIPGAVAVTVIATIATILSKQPVPQPFWKIYVLPYAYFWYLQAILVIFFTYCLFDVLTRGRYLVASMLAALAMFFAKLDLTSVFAVNGVSYLLPYFVMGILLVRKKALFEHHHAKLVATAIVLIAFGIGLNMIELARTGSLPHERQDVQSLCVGIGACATAFLLAPRIDALHWIGPPSFVIYLYHIIGTSAARRALHAVHVESIAIHLVVGMLAGILTGYAIYRLVRHNTLTALIVSGEKLGPTASSAGPIGFPATRAQARLP